MSTDHAKVHETKRETLLEMLKQGGWFTHVDCKTTGGVRYSARILELKRLGYVIEDRPSTTYENGKDYQLTGRGLPQKKRVKVFITEEDAELLVSGHVTKAATAAVRKALRSFKANKEKL
jgi:hypothetical protein